MNRAQRRQLTRSRRKSRKGGLPPTSPGKMSADAIRDMRAAARFHREGDLARAATLYQSVLGRFPDQPDALHFLGLIADNRGHREKAMKLIDRSLRLDPRNAVYHKNRGNLLRQAGALAESIAAYRCAVRYEPNYAVAHNNLGVALDELGESKEAEVCFRRAMAIQPAYYEPYVNLGTCLSRQARPEEAESVFREAIEIAPMQFIARHYLATILVALGRIEDAIAAARSALDIAPDHLPSLQALARLLEANCRFSEAEQLYRAALERCPEEPVIWNNFGNLMRATARLPDALAAYRKALELAPAAAVTHSNVVFSLAFDPGISPADILAEARRWNDVHAVPLAARARDHLNSRIIERQLRVGFVSSDFRDHAVGTFLTPLFEAHDCKRIEFFAYADVAQPDERTGWFEWHADCWRNISGLSDAQLAQRIRDDRIDVLIDLAGHTGGNRLLSFAERPAPVQACWLGYGGTTGMDAMGWYITDARADPPGAEIYYRERLIRLPNSLFCYRPDPDAPFVGPLPAGAADHVTFGSFNNLTKVNDRAIACWAEVLHRTPGSRMVIKGRGLDETEQRARIVDAFDGHGIVAGRLNLIGYQKDRMSHLALYNRVDVVLDTFPYSGATTTCEALWMGVPAVTISGDRYVARMGASILGCIGLDELIARDEADFVERAVALAADLTRLEELRESLRGRIVGSPLCDGRTFAAAMEDTIRHMWREWCNQSVCHD